jgi:hypothetical protein
MVLGSFQPLTEMSTRNIPRSKGRPARKADNLTAVCEPIVYKMWDPQYLTTLLASTACYRDTFTFLLYALYYKSGRAYRNETIRQTGVIQGSRSRKETRPFVIRRGEEDTRGPVRTGGSPRQSLAVSCYNCL